MIKLIKNEFIKIFNKKSIYILFAISLLFVVFTNYIYKYKLDENNNIKTSTYDSSYLKYAKEKLNSLDTTKEANKSEEARLRTEINTYELYEKYGIDSWQVYITNEKLINLLTEINESKYITKDVDELSILTSEYNEIINRFDTDNWQIFVKEEINEYEEQYKTYEDYYNNSKITEEALKYFKTAIDIDIQMCNYRLDNNISYAKSYLNEAIDNYKIYSKIVINSDMSDIMKKNNIKDNYALYDYYEAKSMMEVNKYILDNKIDANKVNTNRGILINLFTEYELIIIIVIVMISGIIVSSEFNKGTIKQLLLTPHTRNTILLSKYLTCILMAIFTVLTFIIMQVVIGTLFFGVSSLKVPVIIYNFNRNIVCTYNVFYYLLILLISKLPMMALIITFTLLISMLTLNSVISIIFGLLIYISTPVLNSLANNLNIIFLKYSPPINWDLSIYLFGMIAKNKSITLSFSLITCLLYLIFTMLPSFVLFNKKDIKNI